MWWKWANTKNAIRLTSEGAGSPVGTPHFWKVSANSIGFRETFAHYASHVPLGNDVDDDGDDDDDYDDDNENDETGREGGEGWVEEIREEGEERIDKSNTLTAMMMIVVFSPASLILINGMIFVDTLPRDYIWQYTSLGYLSM